LRFGFTQRRERSDCVGRLLGGGIERVRQFQRDVASALGRGVVGVAARVHADETQLRVEDRCSRVAREHVRGHREVVERQEARIGHPIAAAHLHRHAAAEAHHGQRFAALQLDLPWSEVDPQRRVAARAVEPDPGVVATFGVADGGELAHDHAFAFVHVGGIEHARVCAVLDVARDEARLGARHSARAMTGGEHRLAVDQQPATECRRGLVGEARAGTQRVALGQRRRVERDPAILDRDRRTPHQGDDVGACELP
jgi:hypothetical protein